MIRETGKDHVSTALRTKNVHSLVGILTCLSLAILAARTREILEFEVVDLMNDDAEDPETVAWVRRSTVDIQLLGSVDRSTSLGLRTKSETEVGTKESGDVPRAQGASAARRGESGRLRGPS